MLNRADLIDAIEYINETLSDEGVRYSFEDFEVGSIVMVSPYEYGDLYSWLETEPREFLEDPSLLEKFRGSEWAQRADGWNLAEDIPPIIIVDFAKLTDVADGRGRINYAIGMGFSVIPAVFLKGN